MEKYKKMLLQTNPNLLSGRQEMRPQERRIYDENIRVPEHFYSSEDREKKFGPRRTEFDLEFQFGKDWRNTVPWMEIVLADNISSISYQISNERKMIGEIWNPYEHEGTLQEYISRITWEVPALVKNFLTIVRTIPSHEQDCIKIVVRGSRAAFCGGTWDYQLADFLSYFYKNSIVDLYDINEVPASYEIRNRGCCTKVSRIKSLYNGQGEGYDVFVDDAYVGLIGTQNVKPKSPFWSLKRHDKAHDEFLHTREGREFSHSPLFSIASPCPCLVCRSIASFSKNALVFESLRNSCLLLGAKPCTLPCSMATLAKSLTVSVINTGGVLLSGEKERRDVIDARQIAPTKEINGVAVPHRPGDSLAVQKARVYRPLTQSDLKGWWANSTVHFVGVEPTIIAGENYKHYSGISSFVSDPSVVIFVSSIDSMSAVYADVIWCPDDVPGYSSTGRVHSNFKEHVRKRRVQSLSISSSYDSGLDIDLLPSENKICVALPSRQWRIVDRHTLHLSSCQKCRVVHAEPFPCDDHLVIRAVCSKPPSRKKQRKKGVYCYAPGSFRDATGQWYALVGSDTSYEECIANIPWEV